MLTKTKPSPFTDAHNHERCPVLESKALRYQHNHRRASDRSTNKAPFRLAAKITPRTGKLDSRYTSARVEKSANGSSICWDCSFTLGSYLQGAQRLGWRLGSSNCFHGDPSVRTATSLYLARGPEWMQWVSLVHKGLFHHRLIRAFTPTLSILERKHPLLATDLSVGPCDADSIFEVEHLTMQMVECWML